MRRLFILALGFFFAAAAFAQQAGSSVDFPPFEKWREAVLAGNSAALTALYTQSSAPDITGGDKKAMSLQDEVAFWTSWKAQGLTSLTTQVVQEEQPSPNIHMLVLQLTLTMKKNGVAKKQFVAMAQNWFREGDQWRLGIVKQTAATRLRQPLENKQIYDPSVNATEEIAEAVRTAEKEHKRVLLVFGGNWCFDCHVLDEAFHSPEIAPTLNKSFVVAHIDIGEMNKNLDVAEKYQIPLKRGVPAIAVLGSDGKLLFSQKQGEFEAARSMAPEDILAFLNKWKSGAGRTQQVGN
jgi:thioredoxin-related protein